MAHNTVRIPFCEDRPILIRGRVSFLLAAVAWEKFPRINPEQDLLCATNEFAGMTLYSENGDLVIENCRGTLSTSSLEWHLSIAEEKI